MVRTCGLVIAVSLLVVACGGGDSGNAVVQTARAPEALQYGLGIGEVGTPFGPYPPTVSGTVTAYSVSPPLPAGLTLDPTSGVMSGTPLTGSFDAYTVTASNPGGSTTLTVALVVLVPPTLSYTAPVTGAVGAPLHAVPTLSGDVDEFSILPALPEGLLFDTKTGTLSGTPSRARVPVTYTVTASNAGGAYANADLLLSIDPPPAGTAVTGVFRSDTVIGLGYVSGAHSGLTDSSGSFTYESGHGVSFSVGAVSIGSVANAKQLITFLDLLDQGTVASNYVVNVARFLIMLDQDGNLNNGIQISAAVTAAAANWSPVDFGTADLATALTPLIQQANAADGHTHVLPDAVAAQAHLRNAFYCTHSGRYSGTYATDAAPGAHTYFTASVFPDGRMQSSAAESTALQGFDVQTNDAGSSLLHASFVQSTDHPSAHLKGTFADATYLSGTYEADTAGSFHAVGDRTVTSTYKFVGVLDDDPSASVLLFLDDANQLSGSAGGYLSGTLSGNTFSGTITFRSLDPYSHHTTNFPASGTYSNTAAGVTLSGHYTGNGGTSTFSTVGCRAN